MTERIPADVSSPGEVLQEELEARSWTPDDLARLSGLDRATIDVVLAGTQRISVQIAEALAKALGTSAVLWLNMDHSYWYWKGI